MAYKDLRQQVEELVPQLAPAFVESATRALLRQGEDVGGGVNAIRLVKHLLGNPRAGGLPFPIGTPGDFLAWCRRRLTGSRNS